MKKSSRKKTEELNNKQKERMLWIIVVLISGIILLGWMYNFMASTSAKISNSPKKELPHQITDLKKQLQEIKGKFKEFNLKNASSSNAEIEKPSKKNGRTSTSTDLNNFNTEQTK